MAMATLALQIEKMHCGACVRRVTQTLNAIPETHADAVEIGSARVTSKAPPETLLQALTAAGFPAQVSPAQP